MQGTVTKYDRARSYGFILPDDENLPDYFVVPKFIADRMKFLMPGWRVEFTPVETEGHFQAHDVRVLSRVIAIQRADAPKLGRP